jgi:D-alanine-D-alanine ligase
MSSRTQARIAVLLGGRSAEREVSLVSGRECAAALREEGYHVIEVDAGPDLAAVLTLAKPDVVFNALHGRWGEDGCVQGILEWLRIPYTHSGVLASALAMDKERAKQAFAAAGLPVAESRLCCKAEIRASHPIAPPYVVKPVNEGSSVGVAIVTNESNYGNPIGRDVEGPWAHFDQLLAEPFIKGRELTTAVVGDRALGVTELRPKSGFYDYDAKYTDGMTVHVCPAEIPADIAEACLQMALDAHRLLGCKGTSRSDFRWDDEQGVDGLYLLEVNTQPGMTPLSLVPEQAKLVGMTYEQLVQAIIDEALA